MVRCRDATEGDDLLDDTLRGGRRRSTAVERAPEVVHQYARSPVGERERVGASEAAAGPGDDCDSPFKAQFFHGYPLICHSLRMRLMAQSSACSLVPDGSRARNSSTTCANFSAASGCCRS